MHTLLILLLLPLLFLYCLHSKTSWKKEPCRPRKIQWMKTSSPAVGSYITETLVAIAGPGSRRTHNSSTLADLRLLMAVEGVVYQISFVWSHKRTSMMFTMKRRPKGHFPASDFHIHKYTHTHTSTNVRRCAFVRMSN